MKSCKNLFRVYFTSQLLWSEDETAAFDLFYLRDCRLPFLSLCKKENDSRR